MMNQRVTEAFGACQFPKGAEDKHSSASGRAEAGLMAREGGASISFLSFPLSLDLREATVLEEGEGVPIYLVTLSNITTFPKDQILYLNRVNAALWIAHSPCRISLSVLPSLRSDPNKLVSNRNLTYTFHHFY